ncbi:MAG TPA: hypothetical protein VGF55_30660 [Gemmataceae bacterium]|jgi:photosystem II stability/assembly factor-like uncharacterized protein
MPAARRTLAIVVLLAALPAAAGDRAPAPDLLAAFTARPLGPANMSGRVCDVAVVESKPAVMYVASASGGLWKTANAGTTWTPLTDSLDVWSIGSVAVAPSNPDVVYVGTGEANPRNSVSWGNGVYRSADGGKTWTHLGLRDTLHVGRIAVHPTNPDVAYVAALGHVWGPNAERGLFKTADGGKTWQHSLKIDADTGCIDVVMDPSNPDVLYAAAWQVRRGPFSGGNPAVMTGPGSGLFKTTDGGATWTKMTNGLPDRPLGRCGLAVSRQDPRLVYAVVQTDKTTTDTTGNRPKANAGDLDRGGVFRSEDAGQTWKKVNDLCPRPFYYGQIRIDPSDAKRIYVLGVRMFVSNDGGTTFRDDAAPGIHGDHHALWIDPRDRDHLVAGNDGGLAFSFDRGRTWERLRNLPVSQFYGVAVDMGRPYRVYGGLQDNGSWGGPSRTDAAEGITLADWVRLLGADGFQCQVDPTDPGTVYCESQYGRPRRVDLRTGAAANIQPQPDKGAPAYRFNWNSPILISPHNPRTLYYGGNHLFRSTDRGDHWERVSPDLTRGKPGPSAAFGHTLSTIAESQVRPGLLWVGTDDGKLWLSRNGGAEWTDLTDKLPTSLPKDRWVNRVECAPAAEGTAYVAVSRHRHDDRAPYLFRTADFGTTWQSVAGNLPGDAPVNVVRTSARNSDLLFAGTERGLYVSRDAGTTWNRLRGGLPSVPVNDLVIHPRERELVVGTHGRGIYVFDIAPLEELTAKVAAAPAHLFEVRPATLPAVRPSPGLAGGRLFAVPNPPAGATIWYHLKDAAGGPITVQIADVTGAVVAELPASKDAGLHRLTWNLRPPGRRNGPPPRPIAPGDYAVRLKVGDRTLVRPLRVEAAHPGAAATAEDAPADP